MYVTAYGGLSIILLLFFAETWPKTASGLPSTAGTTASIAFIRRGKIYVGHVGDSAIVLGVQQDGADGRDGGGGWACHPLTRDHKPESQEESRRIQESGGKVVCKSGVPRVVWNRPRMGHRGPVRRSTHIDEIPFLAVARSLGDLWSYNSEEDVFVVSPEPDTFVYPIDISRHRCLILGTDGAWNMLNPAQAVRIVCEAERSNEMHMLNPAAGRQWINPSKRLVDKAIEKWNGSNLRADNTSVVTVMLDPPGPPRAQVLKRQRELAQMGGPHAGGPFAAGGPLSASAAASKVINSDRGSVALVTNTTPEEPEAHHPALAGSHPPEPVPRAVPHPNLGSSSSVPYPPSYAGVSSSSYAPVSRTSSASTAAGSAAAAAAHHHPDQEPSSKSLSIISRFPNSKNRDDVQGQNLAESSSSSSSSGPPAKKKASSSSSSALNRLTSSTAVVDSTTASSSSSSIQQHQRRKGQPSPGPSSSSSSTSAATADDIQCNVVSSSDDDTPVKRTANKRRQQQQLHQTKTKASSSKLSRELSALQLDSPSVMAGKRRGRNGRGGARTRTRSGTTSSSETEEEDDNLGSSDAENDDGRKRRSLRSSSSSSKQPAAAAAASSHKDVEHQCRELTAKIRSIDGRMAKKARQLIQDVKFLQSTLAEATGQERASSSDIRTNRRTRFLRSTEPKQPAAEVPAVAEESLVALPTRSLRPRTPAKAAPAPSSQAPATRTRATPGSSRKRKGPSDAAGLATSAAKSPKTAVQGSHPVVTRSRTARVLQLKNK